MATRKFNWSGPAFVALFLVAVITALHWLLTKFGGSAGELLRIINFIKWIIELLGYLFVAIYAYDYVARKSKGWVIVYWVCIAIIIVFHVLKWWI